MNQIVASLDQQEILHLALLASQSSEHDKAIGLLKQGLATSPDDARMLFLLGAEHAQIGLYDRAIEEIGRSVSLDASVPAAHFQLGLLHMTAADGPQAREAWVPLAKLSDTDAFRVFSDALLRLLDNDLAGCIDGIRHGLTLGANIPALAQSMQRILESALAAQQSGAAQAEKAPEADHSHVFISAYQSH